MWLDHIRLILMLCLNSVKIFELTLFLERSLLIHIHSLMLEKVLCKAYIESRIYKLMESLFEAEEQPRISQAIKLLTVL